MMAIPTAAAVEGFKMKTLDKLRRLDYRSFVSDEIDDEQYQIMYRNFIERDLCTLMVSDALFADSYISSQWLLGIHSVTGSLDQTELVTGYLKSVEQLLFSVLKLHMGGSKTIRKNPSVKGFSGTIIKEQYIYFTPENEAYFDSSLGSLIGFLNHEIKKRNYTTNSDLFDVDIRTISIVIEALISFKDIKRNDRLHKDNLYSQEEIKSIQQSVHMLYFMILGGLKICDTDISKLTNTPKHSVTQTKRTLQQEIEEWLLPIVKYDVPSLSRVN